jgi:hypothetical protein
MDLAQRQASPAVVNRLARKHAIGFVLGFIVLLYLGSYALLSSRGRYEPTATGLNGVKWYAWAPSGFVENFRWSPNLMRVYLPLYVLDCRFWHASDQAEDGGYPINEVADEDVEKIYRAVTSRP